MKPGDMKHSAMNRHFYEGPKLCTQCRQHKPQKGGQKVSTGRYTERWVCAECAR